MMRPCTLECGSENRNSNVTKNFYTDLSQFWITKKDTKNEGWGNEEVRKKIVREPFDFVESFIPSVSMYSKSKMLI